jgi:hypothetical protein
VYEDLMMLPFMAYIWRQCDHKNINRPKSQFHREIKDLMCMLPIHELH